MKKINSLPTIRCQDCHQIYPDWGLPYICGHCGGIYDYESPPIYDPKEIVDQQGMWKYRHTFGLPQDMQAITLGEGQTPLIQTVLNRRKIGLKLEFLNPTGSYKDRGSAVLISHMLARNIREAVEDSSGNAGASFAAYAAKAGIKASVYIPESASGPKRKQIESYGAKLIPIPGERENAARAVRMAATKGISYASHAFLPFGLTGIATIAYEIVEQLKETPGTVIAPVGHGGLLLGVIRGFQAMYNARIINQTPLFIGVQAGACDPLVKCFTGKRDRISENIPIETIAEGVKVIHPVRGKAILELLEKHHGDLLAIQEEDILKDQKELARLGFFVEPTSALVWSAIKKRLGETPEPIVTILTGSGLKYSSYEEQGEREMPDLKK